MDINLAVRLINTDWSQIFTFWHALFVFVVVSVSFLFVCMLDEIITEIWPDVLNDEYEPVTDPHIAQRLKTWCSNTKQNLVVEAREPVYYMTKTFNYVKVEWDAVFQIDEDIGYVRHITNEGLVIALPKYAYT